MRARSRGPLGAFGAIALASAALALACGGSLDSLDGDGGAKGSASGGARDAAGAGSDATSPPPTGTFGKPSPSGTGTGTGTGTVGCSTNIMALGAELGACWGCAAKGCASQLSACEADCPCHTAVAQALECVSNGGSALPCFMPILSTSDPALSAFGTCLLQASGECNCSLNPGSTDDAGAPPTSGDDAMACTPSGGGGTTGNGSCSSTVEETCGGNDYQVVCSCPRGSCVCFGPSTTTVVSFDGCPYCPGLGPGTPTPCRTTRCWTSAGSPADVPTRCASWRSGRSRQGTRRASRHGMMGG